MRLAIVGSRDFTDKKRFNKWMDEMRVEWPDDIELVVSGGARGADTLGADWAWDRNIKTKILRPAWDVHGKSAGFLRNIDIVNEATHVVAFPSVNGKGTQHTIDIARKKLGNHRVKHKPLSDCKILVDKNKSSPCLCCGDAGKFEWIEEHNIRVAKLEIDNKLLVPIACYDHIIQLSTHAMVFMYESECRILLERAQKMFGEHRVAGFHVD